MNQPSPGPKVRDAPANPNLAHGKLASALGLAWVYSGAFWLLCLYFLVQGGYYAGAGAICLRLIATLVVGVGLCGTERWAWAMAVCIAGFYLGAGAALGTSAVHTLLTLPPGTLSWKPVFFGFNTDESVRMLAGIAAVTAVAISNLVLLWKTQAHFDIPHRRPFTILVRDGIGPALLVLMTDLYLLFGWWRPDT